MLKNFLSTCKKINDGLLPASCVLCGNISLTNLCKECEQDLPFFPNACPCCGSLMERSETCGLCLKKTPPFTKTFVLFPYQFPINQLIIGLKFQHNLIYAKMLSDLMTSAVRDHWYKEQSLPDLLIPMPLHPLRLRERGFNQVVEIARPLAKQLKISLSVRNVTRTKATLAQAGLPASARLANVKHAFSARSELSGLHVALLDDVITTGQTIIACSLALQKAAVKRIDVWCCARASILFS